MFQKLARSRNCGHRLSPLEIEELDAISEDKEEEQDPANVSNCDGGEEVVVETQALFQELLQRHVASSWYFKIGVLISHLGGDETIQRPRHR